MIEWLEIEKDPRHIGKEKLKAYKLRKTQWWKNKLAKGSCHYCQKKFPPGELTMDHIVSLARGGKSSKGNIVPCCKKCNNEKKYYTPAEILLKNLNSPSKDEPPPLDKPSSL